MCTALQGFFHYFWPLLSPFFFKAVAHFCRNYVNEKVPRSEDKHSSRKPLCSTTKWGNTSKQIRPPTVCLTCSGVVGRKCCSRSDRWHAEAAVVLWRSCVRADVVFGGGLGTSTVGCLKHKWVDIADVDRCSSYSSHLTWLIHSWKTSLVEAALTLEHSRGLLDAVYLLEEQCNKRGLYSYVQVILCAKSVIHHTFTRL